MLAQHRLPTGKLKWLKRLVHAAIVICLESGFLPKNNKSTKTDDRFLKAKATQNENLSVYIQKGVAYTKQNISSGKCYAILPTSCGEELCPLIIIGNLPHLNSTWTN